MLSKVASLFDFTTISIPLGSKQSTSTAGGIKWCPHSSPELGGIVVKHLHDKKRKREL